MQRKRLAETSRNQSKMYAVLSVAVVLLCGGGGWAVRPASAAARAPGDEVRLWTGGGGALQYDVESVALLNEATRRDQEVGWRLVARLAVRAAACADHETLLHFELREPALHLRGAGRHAEWMARPAGPHSWDEPAQRRSSFYAHWRAGHVLRAYLDPADPPAVAGFKRGIISLFQFQILDGERNETDISGDCDVTYETLSEYDFRKIKRSCSWAGGAEADGVVSRRLVRYSLRPALDALSAVHAEEVHETGAARAGEADAAVKARAWTRLQLLAEPAGTDGACPRGQPGLSAARAALPQHLHEATLPLPALESTANVSVDVEMEEEEGEEALGVPRALQLAASLAAGEPGAGGDEHAARALLRLLPALGAAPAHLLREHLMNIDDVHSLTGCARALGAVGTLAAHEALGAALQLRGAAQQPAADEYLAALSTARAPHAAAVRAVLALAGDAAEPRVRRAALLAAAAAAPRADAGTAAAVRADLAKQLARCKDEDCRCACVTALGNLRRADTAELLLEHAERAPGDRAGTALAALRALDAAPRAALPWARVTRLLRVALDETRALDVRASALDLAVRRSAAAPLPLTEAARALHAERSPHAPELRRVLWQRLHALAPAHEPVRVFLRAVAHDRELGSWHAQAHAGTSSVLVREAGWGAGGWRAQLDSAQLAAGGVLRRGRVQLALRHPAEPRALPALAVELWTRGLDALAGAGAAADEEAAGGLAVEVAGARLPSIALFSSQAELLGHVWAGTGSAPTAVTRAALSLSAHAAALPLLSGVPVQLRTSAAAALALDAHATVSLWSRTASARLDLRASVSARALAVLVAPWGRASVLATAAAPAALSIAADLDFYDRVALCVRAAVPDHHYSRAATLRSVLGARRWRVQRARSLRTPRAGRTLALGRANDAACRALTPHDQ